MQKPLLSVIVPVYNVAPYLTRCVNSIINQTFTNLEIILVDDGSTDASGTMCDDFAKKDSRIKVIHKANGGNTSARKAGLALARADYATYVDSDDWIEANAYECLMQIMLQYNPDCVTSGIKRDYQDYCIDAPEYFASGLYTGQKLLNLQQNIIDTSVFYKSNLSLHLYSKIYKKNVLSKFQETVDDIINIAEDASVVLSLLFNANSVYVSGKTFYHYCIRKDSIMGTQFKNEEKNLETLFLHVQNVFTNASVHVQNAMQQYKFFRAYVLLMRNAQAIMRSTVDVLYPFGNLTKQERLVLYCGGKFARELQRFLLANGYNVVLWVDKANTGVNGVQNISALTTCKYDKIIIGTHNSLMIENIRTELINNYAVNAQNILSVDASML